MNNNESVFKEEKMLKVVAIAGTYLDSAIIEAIDLSKLNGLAVCFDFNGIELKVDKNSTLESVHKMWEDIMEKPKFEFKKEIVKKLEEKQEKTMKL